MVTILRNIFDLNFGSQTLLLFPSAGADGRRGRKGSMRNHRCFIVPWGDTEMEYEKLILNRGSSHPMEGNKINGGKWNP